MGIWVFDNARELGPWHEQVPDGAARRVGRHDQLEKLGVQRMQDWQNSQSATRKDKIPTRFRPQHERKCPTRFSHQPSPHSMLTAAPYDVPGNYRNSQRTLPDPDLGIPVLGPEPALRDP